MIYGIIAYISSNEYIMFLFINSGTNQRCGIYQYGLRVYEHIKQFGEFDYAEVDTLEEYTKHVQAKDYKAYLLNYHPYIFHWLPNRPNTFYLYHETNIPFPIERKFIFNTDPTATDLGIPRPLYLGDVTCTEPNVPTFGSFGFGFENKGYERIIQLVQSEYNVANIRFLIPHAFYGDDSGSRARAVVDSCRRCITKPGIKLMVCHNFLSNAEVVAFLASNSMNIFLYDKMDTRGISSVIDYALVAKKPIAISDSHMFRHIYSDAICAYKRPLKDILADGTRHIDQFSQKWSSKNLYDALMSRISSVLEPHES